MMRTDMEKIGRTHLKRLLVDRCREKVLWKRLQIEARKGDTDGFPANTESGWAVSMGWGYDLRDTRSPLRVQIADAVSVDDAVEMLGEIIACLRGNQTGPNLTEPEGMFCGCDSAEAYLSTFTPIPF